MTMRPPVAALLLLVLAACGDQTRTTASAPSPSTRADDGVRVTCGASSSWPPSVMTAGLEGVLTEQEVEGAFQQFLDDPELAPELELSFLRNGAEDTQWRLLAVDGDVHTLGLGTWTAQGPQGQDTYVFSMAREGNGWDWNGGGSCSRLELVPEPGETWVQVTAPEEGLDRDSILVAVGVNEMECTSGRDPRPHLNPPQVVESDDSVTVYWTSKPPTGGQDCQGNAPVEQSLELSEPLGDRELRDGSVYPPQPVGELLR